MDYTELNIDIDNIEKQWADLPYIFHKYGREYYQVKFDCLQMLCQYIYFQKENDKKIEDDEKQKIKRNILK